MTHSLPLSFNRRHLEYTPFLDIPTSAAISRHSFPSSRRRTISLSVTPGIFNGLGRGRTPAFLSPRHTVDSTTPSSAAINRIDTPAAYSSTARAMSTRARLSARSLWSLWLLTTGHRSMTGGRLGPKAPAVPFRCALDPNPEVAAL